MRVIFAILRGFLALILIALLAIASTGWSAVYVFQKPAPFSGPDIFNPYRNLDTAYCWKKANFHVHTRVKGPLNECEYWPEETYEALDKLGYDIVTFSNHNEITKFASDPEYQVNVYEHGYNLFKYHKLVFGSEKVNLFDNILPLFVFQKQFQLDLLGKDSDFIQMNHPFRTGGTSPGQMSLLTGYQIMELDSGRTLEQEYWDWALSAGHYSFGLANDDLHYPDMHEYIAVRSNFLCTPSARYEDIKKTLLDGCYYSMHIPDYGDGDWSVKYEKNANLPYLTDIGLKDSTIYISTSVPADSIRVTGQDHRRLAAGVSCDRFEYTMSATEPYARFTVFFPEGEVIYSNPFARYDASVQDTPYVNTPHKVNVLLTVLWNLAVLVVSAGIVLSIVWIFKGKNEKRKKV